jgi:hypothetical protein
MADKKLKKYTMGELAAQLVSEIAQGNFSPKVEKRSNDVNRSDNPYGAPPSGGGAVSNAVDIITGRKNKP